MLLFPRVIHTENMVVKSERLVAVAIPAPLHTSFDYRVGDELTIVAGARLKVPFGRREVIGVALEA